ncbi:MAG: Holliday junction branch migration DNA helicase RuvB [Candidatus Eisenbacteria bacterium]|nr:Holliday junction branch migration DNA helicase RuvB [Candidatus Latescibacterota bacterium]MBD3300899.1 Holliday junction branch migration DNA helicase RuvB [Candidatus Eisenbacteria bacterium]
MDPVAQDQDVVFETSLRPRRLAEFVGQARLRGNLEVLIKAARLRREPLDHVLLTGPPGLGKTTLALLIAREMEAEIRCTSGPALEKPGDLAGILTSLPPGGVLFVDEIHRLSRTIEEYLYPAMEDYRIDIILDRGPGARSVRLHLEPFTLVGATTRAGLLTAPLRARFGFHGRVDYYGGGDLEKILSRSAELLSVAALPDALDEIARRSRGTPRIANRLLRRVRDFAQVDGLPRVTRDAAAATLARLDIDETGLDEMDRRILDALVRKHRGGPVGISTLAMSVGEEPGTLEEVHEPFLIQQGLLERTRAGRIATARAFELVGVAPPNGTAAGGLF